MFKTKLSRKRNIVLAIIILAAVSASCIYYSQPKNIVNNLDSYTIWRVAYNNEDITELVDCDALASIVSNYKCGRLPHSFAPYQLEEVKVEINGVADNKLLHILLGDINVTYESAEKGGYSIRKSAELLTEILQIIQ